MTGDNGSNSISRRNVLAGLGAVGVGGALAGAGTSAFFSDEETFDGNELVAGELDLKVDWEEHYSDWSEDEIEGVGDWSMDPDDADDLFGFPSTAPLAEQSVFVEHPQRFMKNTAIEAFPDQTETTSSKDAVEEGHYDAQREDMDDGICDITADMDEVLSHPYRTRGTFGEDPNPQTTEAGDSLIMIDDVKPGDFGELTLSFHLCGNPGYVWLTGELVDASENGKTEPERDDSDERTGGDPDLEGNEYVELLDEIRAAFWYDTGKDGVYGPDIEDKDYNEGDNIFNEGEVLLPITGSLRSVLRALEEEMFLLQPEPVSHGGKGSDGENGPSTGGVTGEITENTDDIVEIFSTTGDPRFDDTRRNWTCTDYEDRLDQFDTGDLVGSEVLNPDTAPIGPGMEYGGCTTITVDDINDEDGEITLSTSGPIIIVSVKGGNEGEKVYVFDNPVVLDEATFTTPTGQNISNVDVCCRTDDDGENGHGDKKRECFENSTTAYVGFEWWLPVDHANEIQTDSVEFNLGFYTEQCRHNDGSGMISEEPSD